MRTSFLAIAMLTLSITLGVGAAHAQPFIPDGDDYVVNTTTTASQETPDISRRGSGFVIVWANGATADEEVLARLFDDNGDPVGDEFQVNTNTDGAQKRPVVAQADDFVVVWERRAVEEDIIGQRFDSQGQKVDGEFTVNTTTANEQALPAISSASASLDFVVVWQSDRGQDGDQLGVFAQRFASDATPQGTEFQVNTTTDDDQGNPAVARRPDDSFLVVWESEDGDRKGIFAQRFDSIGDPQGPEFQVNEFEVDEQVNPAVAAYEDGYVVVWVSEDGEGDGTFGRRFDENGDAEGPEFQINSTTDGDQENPAVSAFDTGEFVVVWDDSDGVFGQEYDAAGDRVGAEFPVNTTTADMFVPQIATRDAAFTVAWEFEELGADDILGRNYVAVTEPVIALLPERLRPAVLLGGDAPDQGFLVRNAGAGTLSYTIDDDMNWLSVSPTNGTSTGESDLITVSYSSAGLGVGVYPATITVSDTNAFNDPQTIDVLLIVTAGLPAIAVSPSTLAPEVAPGGDAPDDSFSVTNAGGFLLSYEVGDDKPWISVDPQLGSLGQGASETITVSYTTAGLEQGTYEGTIIVSDESAVNDPQTIDVVLTVPEPSAAALSIAVLTVLGFIGLALSPPSRRR